MTGKRKRREWARNGRALPAMQVSPAPPPGLAQPKPDAAASDRTERASTQNPIFRLWHHRNYRIFMCGQTPNNTTSWMQRVGVGWFAWELTHSSIWLGAVAAADLAPMLILAPLAGALTDRSDPMRQIRITQFLMFLQAITMAAVTLAGLMTVELLFALSLVTGTIQPLYATARQTIVPSTVPRSEFPSAVAIDSALFQASRFVGPAIAALIIPHAGVGGTFLAHVCGTFGLIVALNFMRLPPYRPQPRRGANIFQDIGESLRYVYGHKGILPLFVLLTVASSLVRPLQDMLPGFAGGVFHSGAVGLSWLASSMGVGAMASAGWIGYRGRIDGLSVVVLSGFLGLVVATFGFVATDRLWLGVLFAAMSGCTLNLMSTSTQALVQSAVADHMRGRVMSLYILVFRGTPAIGALVIGVLADRMGLRLAFAATAAICFAVWFAILPQRRAIAETLEA